MYHRVSDMIRVVEVMNQKAQVLREMKYGYKSDCSDAEVDTMISDIQSLAMNIAHDKGNTKPEEPRPGS